MIFTLTDRHYNVLDSYETDDYLIGQYIGSVLETLDINISVRSLQSEYWVRGNYIMCRNNNGRGYWFTIYDDEDNLNGADRSLSCYSGTIDIVAEEFPPLETTEAQPFEWYFEQIFYDTGIVLGVNELSGLSRKLKFESQNATNAEMLQFVLNAFDNAAAQLDVTFDGSRPSALTLNVYKRLGEEQPQAILSDEDDSLTDLDRTGSISTLGTSLLCYGAADGDQNQISLVGKLYAEKDDEGNTLYISPKDSPRILSVKAREEYFVQLPGKRAGEYDGYINRSYSSQAGSQDALWSEGLAQLKKIDHAQIDYKANGYIEKCSIGDNVQIVVQRMRPAIMVSARVSEYKFNDDDPERNEYTFSNFVELESDMSDLDKIMAEVKKNTVYIESVKTTYQISDQGDTTPAGDWSETKPATVPGKYLWAKTTTFLSNGTSSDAYLSTYTGKDGSSGKDGTDAILLNITSVNGNIFKNTGVSTTATVTIIMGDKWIDTEQKLLDQFGPEAYLQWQIKKVGEIKFTDIPRDDPRLSDGGFIFTLNVNDIDQKATLNCNLNF